MIENILVNPHKTVQTHVKYGGKMIEHGVGMEFI